MVAPTFDNHRSPLLGQPNASVLGCPSSCAHEADKAVWERLAAIDVKAAAGLEIGINDLRPVLVMVRDGVYSRVMADRRSLLQSKWQMGKIMRKMRTRVKGPAWDYLLMAVGLRGWVVREAMRLAKIDESTMLELGSVRAADRYLKQQNIGNDQTTPEQSCRRADEVDGDLVGSSDDVVFDDDMGDGVSDDDAEGPTAFYGGEGDIAEFDDGYDKAGIVTGADVVDHAAGVGGDRGGQAGQAGAGGQAGGVGDGAAALGAGAQVVGAGGGDVGAGDVHALPGMESVLVVNRDRRLPGMVGGADAGVGPGSGFAVTGSNALDAAGPASPHSRHLLPVQLTMETLYQELESFRASFDALAAEMMAGLVTDGGLERLDEQYRQLRARALMMNGAGHKEVQNG